MPSVADFILTASATESSRNEFALSARCGVKPARMAPRILTWMELRKANCVEIHHRDTEKNSRRPGFVSGHDLSHAE
jgi:hypothetical protein